MEYFWFKSEEFIGIVKVLRHSEVYIIGNGMYTNGVKCSIYLNREICIEPKEIEYDAMEIDWKMAHYLSGLSDQSKLIEYLERNIL